MREAATSATSGRGRCKALRDASFSLEVGEIRIVERDPGPHISCRLLYLAGTAYTSRYTRRRGSPAPPRRGSCRGASPARLRAVCAAWPRGSLWASDLANVAAPSVEVAHVLENFMPRNFHTA